MDRTKCPTCQEKWDSESHKDFNPHGFVQCNKPGDPFYATIDVQDVYDSSESVARVLAHARAEMRKYFPDKQIEILPHRMMLRNDGSNGLLIGQGFYASYIAFEK